MRTTNRIICPTMCPMINAQGFCESAWRRAGQMRECPHKKMRKAVSSLNTADKKVKSGAGAGRPTQNTLPNSFGGGEVLSSCTSSVRQSIGWCKLWRF